MFMFMEEQMKKRINRSFFKIPPVTLSELHNPGASNLKVGNLYFHPNPLIRWIFWERLRTAWGLSRGIPAESVLDLGCGGGEFIPSLSRVFSRVVGVDLNTTNARKLVDYFSLENVSLVEGDFIGVSLKETSFDLVIGCDVLEHQKKLSLFLEKVRAVLKPQGRLIVCVPEEGRLYRSGRQLFRIPRPDDHYHRAPEIIRELKTIFLLEKGCYVPSRILPLYQILRFRKN